LLSDYEELRYKVYYDEELDQLKKYLSENNIYTDSTASGLRMDILEDGRGIAIDSGDYVKVQYQGRLLDGEEFDSGIYSFFVGKAEVIKGWDEGVDLLNQGSKAILYIPSKLAYGSRGNRNIPPFSTLIFEIEVLEVTKPNENL
jgi:FKBP-type peptidyl-prolyl cis-trans isomerase